MKNSTLATSVIVIVVAVLAVALVLHFRVPRPADMGPTPGLDTSSWNTATDPASGVAFRYPADFGTAYISTTDWPPKVAVLDTPYSCTEGGTSTSLPAGQTKRESINGHEYCVTEEGEGAAGSTYIQYAYAAPKDGKTMIFTFSLRYVQCANYEDPKKAECTAERDAFSPDATVDAMFGTASLPSGS